ncbi:MAG TPA: hypothetical protein VFI06_13250 [Chitinophagaceae bacterium]|nr:hypothetical protein [Chitinophagaceae bacterium]
MKIPSALSKKTMKLAYYIPLLLFLSCTGPNSTEHNPSLRDSVIKFYKEELAVNNKFDTSEFSYQLLNAYTVNDSALLNKLLTELRNERENRKWWNQLDSCIELTSLADMHIDEGYRIEYDGALCPLRQITTIYKRNDSIKLNFLLYQLKWDTAECRKLEELDRVLASQNWENFLDKVYQGDFWGLKSDNNRHGVDGSAWRITGFKKDFDNSSSKYHFVYRWGETTLHEAFEFLTLLAANKNGCLRIRANK